MSFTKSEKETIAVKRAVEAFNVAKNNPNNNHPPIYAAIIAARHYGTFGEVAVRKHFNINPDWTVDIYKSMGGIYATY